MQRPDAVRAENQTSRISTPVQRPIHFSRFVRLSCRGHRLAVLIQPVQPLPVRPCEKAIRIGSSISRAPWRLLCIQLFRQQPSYGGAPDVLPVDSSFIVAPEMQTNTPNPSASEYQRLPFHFLNSTISG